MLCERVDTELHAWRPDRDLIETIQTTIGSSACCCRIDRSQRRRLSEAGFAWGKAPPYSAGIVRINEDAFPLGSSNDGFVASAITFSLNEEVHVRQQHITAFIDELI